MEVKPNAPFTSPVEFEETMQEAVLTLDDFLEKKYKAHLLGTGMHPLLRLSETGIWSHRHRQIYEAYSRVFNLKRHGWLNIQSFQLNLPYSDEKNAFLMHNLLAEICAYLPAIAASSPIYEGKISEHLDSRLHFYKLNQKEVPSVTGDVIPVYAHSFAQYKKDIIEKYSNDLARVGVKAQLPGKDWVNSRGVIFRFDRKALEIRVMDEQECVKSDVAMSCFVRALLRGLMAREPEFLPREILLKDFNAVVKSGLNARILHPHGGTARKVCRHFFQTAWANASSEEKQYLSVVRRRIEDDNLSETIKSHVKQRALKTDLREAIVSVYLRLVKSLMDNEPYF